MKAITLILAILLLACCCGSALGLGGVSYWFIQSPEAKAVVQELSEVPTPTIAPAIVSRPVAEVERSTEEALARVVVPERDLLALAMRLKKLSQPIPRVVNSTPPKYNLGDKMTFWVTDNDAIEHFQSTAILRYITPHLYMWVQEGYDVSDEDLKRSAERFENRTYSTDREFFGSEWTPGVDNDPHLHIFNGRVPGVGGYYSASDEYSRLVNPYSNEKEIFYINLDNAMPGSDHYNSVLAHEFQHMIHWNNDRNEDTWVNEGCADLATYLNGYDEGGNDWVFMSAPDTQLNAWGDSPSISLPHYGGSYLFMVYFLDRFGEEVMRQVVADPANGVIGFNDVLSRDKLGVTFNDVFADWVTADYLNNPALADGRYGYKGLDPGKVAIDAIADQYPVEHASTVHQYAADYIELGGKGDLTITFQGSTVVKLAPTDPHSGSYVWWSNRGDDSDMTLTRAFDLSRLDRATLTFWTWYDIEAGWDYAYAEVSTDGGKTWDTLQGKYTTDRNKSGNSFGHAYTGLSGRPEGSKDEPAAWVQEEIDLTPYAGKSILLRFEYVTDDAVNHPGWMIDDIAIPELGYVDDVEAGEGGWEAQGFVRTNNILPQHFLVQVIEMGKTPQVQRLVLDKNNHGEITVRGVGSELERAVLVIAGLSSYTTEVASYEFKVVAQ